MRPKARVLALIVLFSNLAEVGKEDVIRTVMEAAKEGRHPLAPATASFWQFQHAADNGGCTQNSTISLSIKREV
jgi:hypothetical protein